MKPELSIITVNYNGFADTCEMIDSVKKNLDFPYELIVVDNASRENEAESIHKIYPWVNCIRSEKNLGFAGGNNLAIKQAQGRFILLLNNDTYITDNTLSALMYFLDKNPTAGAASPKLKFAEAPNDIQFAGYTDFSPITMRNHIIGFGEKDNGQYETPTINPFLHGAAMMVKAEVISQTRLIPEMYFLYYEELDWGNRIKEAGYNLWYVPSCTVYHKESRSIGQSSPLKIFYMTRNRLLFTKRNFKSFNCYASIAYQLLIAIPKSLIVSVFNNRFDLAQATVKGVFSFFNVKKQDI